jgi:hypothetical protein
LCALKKPVTIKVVLFVTAQRAHRVNRNAIHARAAIRAFPNADESGNDQGYAKKGRSDVKVNGIPTFYGNYDAKQASINAKCAQTDLKNEHF